MATTPNVGYYDVKTGQWRPATPQEQAAALAARDAQRRRSRNQFIKGSVLGTAGVLAGGYGLAALGGAGGGSTLAGMVPQGSAAAGQVPAGTLATGALATGAPTGAAATGGGLLASSAAPITGLAPYAPNLASAGLAPSVWANAANTAANTGGGGGWLGRLFGNRGTTDLIGQGVGALTSIYGTRAQTGANERTNQMLQDQFEESQKWLKEQDALMRTEREAVEAEKKRQWEAEQAEKLRQWQELEPWRESGRRNLVGMNTMLDQPKPQPVAYQPTFSYRP